MTPIIRLSRVMAVILASNLLSQTVHASEAWGYWSCLADLGDEMVRYQTQPILYTYDGPEPLVFDPLADEVDTMMLEADWAFENGLIFQQSQPEDHAKFIAYIESITADICGTVGESLDLSTPFDSAEAAEAAQVPGEMDRMMDDALADAFGKPIRTVTIVWERQVP